MKAISDQSNKPWPRFRGRKVDKQDKGHESQGLGPPLPCTFLQSLKDGPQSQSWVELAQPQSASLPGWNWPWTHGLHSRWHNNYWERFSQMAWTIRSTEEWRMKHLDRSKWKHTGSVAFKIKFLPKIVLGQHYLILSTSLRFNSFSDTLSPIILKSLEYFGASLSIQVPPTQHSKCDTNVMLSKPSQTLHSHKNRQVFHWYTGIQWNLPSWHRGS